MLTHLTVNNFAIAEQVELDFDRGMTVITGETGAGKSIVLDALGLTLGDRADSGVVRYGEERSDICATFDVSNIPRAKQWLLDHDLDLGDECILRRVITKEGRSRGYINSQPAPLQNLRELGEMLIDIHSQHEHQSLLRKETHAELLDSFGELESLSTDVKKVFKQWQSNARQLEQLLTHDEERDARIQLLTYQQQELEELALQPGEVDALEAEQSKLSNAESILQSGHHCLNLCSEGEPAIEAMLSQAMHQIESFTDSSAAFKESYQMLSDALIQVQEAASTLGSFLDNFELDPQRLQEIEERLSLAYQLARKHKASPDELPQVLTQIQAELQKFDSSESSIEDLQKLTESLALQFTEKAGLLSENRKMAAAKLDQEISNQLKQLNMANVTFVTELSSLDKFDPRGLEAVEFLVSTNQGQPAKPLAKVASGGELSRISLAIQVILANTSTTPTLVFDEVDVGIGGSTAEIVGQMLRALGNRGQVLCVTHLAQVASNGHHHFHVSKHTQNGSTKSAIANLKEVDRITEIARMLGGIDITEKSLAHAKEMLECV